MNISNMPFVIEGSKSRLEYVITGETDLMTQDLIEELKLYPITIYFNDYTAKHWIFDFDIDGVMFEGTEVLPDNENKIIFNVSKLPELFKNKA